MSSKTLSRELPNNLEAEKSVLGSCFLSKYALQKASENLLPDSFYGEKNKIIYQAMLDLQEEATPIDITTITSQLNKKGELVISYQFEDAEVFNKGIGVVEKISGMGTYKMYRAYISHL